MEKDKFFKVPVKISARHIHITEAHFKKLFGKDKPTFYKKLGQSQFAAKETLIIKAKKRFIERVRIVAPFRKQTQVEISMHDAIYLKMKPVIRLSGDLKGTPGIKLIGPRGEVDLKEGVIVAQRHLHLHPNDAKKLGLNHKDIISILIKGKRAVLFGDVVVRVNPLFNMCVHLDTDEGNAAAMPKQGNGYIVF